MNWTMRFVTASIATVVLFLLVLWAAFGFARLNIHGSVLIALIFGAVGVSALTIGLMALLFYSQREEEKSEALHILEPPALRNPSQPDRSTASEAVNV